MSTQQQIAVDTVLAAGPILGQIGVPGLAVGSGLYLFFGLRGAKRAKLNRDKAANLGAVFGALAVAAGGTIGQAVSGVGEVPTSVFQGVGQSMGGGDFGLAAAALGVGICTYVPDWNKLGIPAFGGISLGASAAGIGGLWLIANNIVMMAANALGSM